MLSHSEHCSSKQSALQGRERRSSVRLLGAVTFCNANGFLFAASPHANPVLLVHFLVLHLARPFLPAWRQWVLRCGAAAGGQLRFVHCNTVGIPGCSQRAWDVPVDIVTIPRDRN